MQALSWPLAARMGQEPDMQSSWQALFYFNLYRVCTGFFLLTIAWKLEMTQLGSIETSLFIHATLGYLILGSASMLLINLRFPGFNWQLFIQVLSDIVFFSIMMYTSGGLQSGLGALLLITLAGAGMIGRGRMSLLFAFLATLGLFFQEMYTTTAIPSHIPQYSQVGLLCIAYFAVSWLAHYLAKCTRINEQLIKERETDLAQMAQINQLVIQDLQEGVLVVDAQGVIRQRNSYADKLLKLNSFPISGTSLKLSECAPEIAHRINHWHGDIPNNSDLLRLEHSNALVRTRFLPIQQDLRNGVVIFLEDMERLQEQFQQIKLMALGRLTANIAHEIRNPLSAIHHAAELLEEELVDDPTANRLVHIIQDNTQRLSRIVQDILQLNRHHISKQSEINLHDFIQTFLEDFCLIESIDTNRFKITVDTQAFISFNRDHLNQVLWNLCRNAWRHCRKQAGSIRIELVSVSGNSIQLNLIDDGPGVDPQHLKQIFEPFYTTATNGTGLGLYIAREMCETNLASLECIESPNGGHFRITARGGNSCH